MNDKLEIYLKRKIARTKNNIKRCENYSSDTHTFHGGWEKGYHEGRLSILEDILDMIEDEKESFEREKSFRDTCIENFSKMSMYPNKSAGKIKD